MPIIAITTTPDEQEKVLEVVRTIDSTKAISVARLAKMANMNASRVRYAIADLVDQGRIVRVPIKAFNKNYIRYSYKEALNV